MNIVIVGAGKVGFTLAEQLSQEGYNTTIVDNDSAVVESVVNRFDVRGVVGNGASYDVQLEAGVQDADLLIAATSSDELNILSCMVARKVGVKHTIARVRNPDYSKQLQFMKQELGLSMVVNPEYSAALEISRMLRFPSAIKIETFAKGRVDLVELKINEQSPFVDLPVYALKKQFQLKVLICAVQREEEVIIPSGDFVLQVGDRIHVAASTQDINQLFKTASVLKDKVRSVMVTGGGKISFYLSQLLEGSSIHLKIIEHDVERCQELVEQTNDHVMIIQGDGTDQSLLLEEGIESTDAFVALTGIDEENILVSMFAGKKNVNKIITKVNRVELTGMLESLGIESVVSPKHIAANEIIRYVRAMQNSVGNHVETLCRLVNNQVEAIEFQVKEDPLLIGIPLEQLSIKPNILVSSIIRNGTVIIPDGKSSFQPGDSVVVVTTNQYLDDLSDILN